jgi:magnesium transporter
MIWYLLVCSMIGGLSVSVTTGLGSAIVTSVMGDNQVSVSQAQRNEPNL